MILQRLTAAVSLVAIGLAPHTHADSPSGPIVRQLRDAVVMEGLDLLFHEAGPTFGELRKPTFWVHAVRATCTDSMRQWSLEASNAVIYREQAENLLLSAGAGFFDKEVGVALLSEGVRLTTGVVVVKLEDLQWDNDQQVATSDHPTEFSDGVSLLSGKAFAVHPRENLVQLTDGGGTIHLASDPAADSADPGSSPSSDSRFKSLDIEFKGTMSIDLEAGHPEEVNDRVVLIMKGVDEADDLKVEADRVKFVYDKVDDKKPSQIRLTGGVRVDHSAGLGSSDEVTVNFRTGDVEFRGNAELTNEFIKKARANVITINLDTQKATLGPGGRIEEFMLNRDRENESGEPAGARP